MGISINLVFISQLQNYFFAEYPHVHTSRYNILLWMYIILTLCSVVISKVQPKPTKIPLNNNKTYNYDAHEFVEFKCCKI